jgi:S1-C subfamily serine protease
MVFDYSAFKTDLDAALDRFDKEAATALCDQLIQALYDPGSQIPPRSLEYIVQALRNKRMFQLMQKLGDCLIQLGLGTYRIRRQYAQALIDQGIYAGALCILQQIATETGPDINPAGAAENAEAVGLIGRVYKQLYVNAGRPTDPRVVALMKDAIDNYRLVYERNPGLLWHGINLVALTVRANKDQLGLQGLPDPAAIATEILDEIREKHADANVWDFATAIEACIALGKADEALIWTERYINSPADAFEIASTLRQFREVWGLDMNSAVGKNILPLLNAALLKREGGSLTISTTELALQKNPEPGYVNNLQAILGNDSFQTYSWYIKGLNACSAVARIGETTDVGVGSGFLLDGSVISAAYNGQIVLLTNAHVVSDDPKANHGSLIPGRSVATLETVDKTLALKFKNIICTSPVSDLDYTVLSFDDSSQAELQKHRNEICAYTVAGPPVPDSKQRVYIIGHPWGGILRISLQDNIFLACNDRFMQYRTPTVPGSSGSPVFDDNWELIGIHHAGGENMPLLDPLGTYGKANEGILIGAICQHCPKNPPAAQP